MLYSPSLAFANEGKQFYKGVAKMVERLSTDEDPLFFDVNASATVSDFRKEAKSLIPAIITEFAGADITTERTQLRGDRSRVVVVDTPNTALGVREYQLGRLLINGGVEIIPNTLFNDDTPEIAQAIGRAKPDIPITIATVEEKSETPLRDKVVGGQKIRTFKIKNPDEPSTGFEKRISEMSETDFRSFSARIMQDTNLISKNQLDFLIETMKVRNLQIPKKVREEYFKRKGE